MPATQEIAAVETDLAEELRRVELLRAVPDAELRRLAEAGRVVRLAPGQVNRAEGDPAEHVFVLLEGQVRVTRNVGGREVVLITYGPHTLFGELPVLMGKDHFFATGRALTECRVFELPNDAFWELVMSCPEVTRLVLREMARRVGSLESVTQQRARLLSLGTFAAGLAHELNNPASAARRATAELADAVHDLKHWSIAVGRRLSDECLMAICGLYDESAADSGPGGALVRMAREESCAAWLEARGVGEVWRLAGSLADAGLGPERLDRLAGMVPPEGLEEALCWLEARARVAMLSRTAADAAARVADVVQAVKGYTLLGQAPLLELDLAEALESTLAVLRPRLASIVVDTEFADDVPPVRAWGGELNQVWTALLENAADALRDGGHLVVRTAREADGMVRVEIEDDGPGIAPEVQGRVFDAFFTTKDVGQGAGLGLTGAYRIVSEHGGTLAFRSRPGQTVFEVRIPVDPPIPTG